MNAESRDVAWSRVPSLVGLTVPEARRVGHDSGVVVIAPLTVHLAGQWQGGA